MNHPWVDSVMKTLTVERQIAQCIWIAAYSNKTEAHKAEISSTIKKYGVGGIVFFQGTAGKQAELTNYFQSISAVPLIIAMDGEWGAGMRLSDVTKYPYQMTLGAIRNDSLIYRMGQAVGAQFRRAGMHINFAPVADINNNPANPVINYRSFGEDRHNVAAKTVNYMRGMQDAGIMTTAKHYPGHGDTNIDSHAELPLISHSRERLDSVELYPFRQLIGNGIGGIMTAHLSLPALDTTPGLPSTLSPQIAGNLLRRELGFRGITVTDAMNMQGVTKYYKPGIADAMALQAGNDVIEFVVDVEEAINETKKFINEKKITAAELELKCRRILALKYWAGLGARTDIAPENIEADLSPATSLALIRDLYASALTVLNNNGSILPLKNIDTLKIASIAINPASPAPTPWQKQLEKYTATDSYSINTSDSRAVDALIKRLAGYNIVIAGVYGLDQRPARNFGVTGALSQFIDTLVQNSRCIVTWFGNPYGIDKVASLHSADGLILTYQESSDAEELAAQLVFGAIGARGQLPVTINSRWQQGFGIITPGNLRMQYGLPENAGLSSELLIRKVDSIAGAGIAAGAYPGCVAMIARRGIAVYHKAYGHHTYHDSSAAATASDIYDLASLTKISVTLPALMHLQSEGRFEPQQTLGSYHPFFRNSNKENLTMQEILAHQAGLKPFLPFYLNIRNPDGTLAPNATSTQQSERYPLMMSPGTYINRNIRREIFREIRKSPLGRKRYVYSDLGFVIAPQIIENITREKWYEYTRRNIYGIIGAGDIVFHPLNRYPAGRIMPTEYDTLLHRGQLCGTVHDETAAMLGGISGHAGLFATSNDLMKLMELYRRMGNYGGQQIISEDIMRQYTAVQYAGNKNRRGLGFDKPALDNHRLPDSEVYPCRSAAPSSFGHTGYTGTFAWVDPDAEISVIFLSNRVYPTRSNNLISDLKIRGSILQAVYDSIK
ncbi:MAG: serine hydrolase [Bacteroidales bacterium]|jgi:beta-glucosidase-like glycosyl hydrolase/CubicO group peptidase (beta-lactamase class C family)|nr:serine hydrolase [Bacteroidales bacterium]